jgi:hypothetical protein
MTTHDDQQTVQQEPLWQKLQDFHIGDPTAAFGFEQRLARENGWTLAYAKQVLREYKRFLYLIVVTRSPLTPCDAVDQAWHLHLSYTRSYWEALCGQILGFPLHHHPTRGGAGQQAHFRQCYQRTLASYAAVFGEAAPGEVWEAIEERFDADRRFIRVRRDRSWIIPKPRYAAPALGMVALMPLLISACTPQAGEHPFWFWLKVAIGVWGVYIVARWLGRALGGARHKGDNGGSGCGAGGGCSSGGSGCCGGGGD